jgi:ssDNA-binding Zn-finger/Zn-ribbon topoisomerase 1
MPHCPRCAATLVWKKVVGGIYLGCPNYPECAKPTLIPSVAMSKTPEQVYSQIASAA